MMSQYKPLLAAGLCLVLTLGGSAAALAQSRVTTTTTTTPTTATTSTTGTAVPDAPYQRTVDVSIIDNNTPDFQARIQNELVDKPAPQMGQTRAAVEALYGPSITALAPNKDYNIYTNETDLTGGRMFQRNLSSTALRVYEVTFNAGPVTAATDKVSDVKLRVIPRLGDHRNLVNKILGDEQVVMAKGDPKGGQVTYSIPRTRYAYYNDVVSTPFDAINMYFNADGFLIGQEFLPGLIPGQYGISSAGRYIERQARFQPDRKVAW